MTDLPRQRERIERKRGQLAAVRRKAARLAAEIESLRARIEAVRRGAADADEDELEAQLGQARQEFGETTGRADALAEDLAERLADLYEDDPEAPLELLAGDQPVALLPVRLETRFDDGQLLVRVYPDEVHVDSHEPALTDDEHHWGRRFWKRVQEACDPEASAAALDLEPDDPLADDPDARHAALVERAWDGLAERFGYRRATWIQQAVAPDEADQLLAGPVEPGADVPGLSFPDDGDGEVVNATWSGPVREPLAVGPAPDVVAGRPEDADEPDGVVDEGMGWMVDFDAAVDAGMGLRIDLTDDQAGEGIDRLVVLGVRASMDAAESARALRDLLAAHHYTDGLSFVPAGTPTNNAPDAAAGDDLDPTDVARRLASGPPAVESWDRSDGDVIARALGIDPESTGEDDHVFGRVQGAGRTEALDARHANSVLWPATWEYYVSDLLVPSQWAGHGEDLPTDFEDLLRWLDAYRRHFTRYVSARGPLATLRVADQPYGLLPVTPLDEWEPLGLDAGPDPWLLPETDLWSEDGFSPPPFDLPEVEPHLVDRLADLRDTFLSSLSAVPQVGTTGDPGRELVRILGMDATATSYRTRHVVGEQALVGDPDLEGLTSRPVGGFEEDDLAEIVRNLEAEFDDQVAVLDRFAHLGVPQSPRVARLAFSPWATGPVEPLVGDDPAATLREASTPDYELLRRTYARRTESLFDLLVYFATLRSFVAARRRLGVRYGDRHVPVEPELYGPRQGTVWDRLADEITGLLADHPALEPGDTYGDALVAAREFTPGTFPELDDGFARHGESLAYLAARDPDPETAARLMAETLDLASHRFDAWATSLATKRLDRLRAVQSADEASRPGVHVGAYGWVEDLRPRDKPQSAGYVHAPSLGQATTAAVLRSGHLSHAGDAHGEALAVDLTADRVRVATDLLDAVRQGLTLGEALGYRFERALHDHAVDLNQYVPAFRRLAPQVAGRLGHGGDPPGEHPPEAVAASTVVDGLALYRTWEAGEIAFGTDGLPAAGTERDALAGILDDLGDAVDAVTDLLTAESVHQLVNGNPERASGSLDALARGEPVPEPAFPRTQRTGTGITHRLLVLFDAGTTPEPAWLDDSGRALQVRAGAAPHLNDWVGRLLGDPSRMRCRAEYLGADETALAERVVSLADLDVSPLDVIYLTEADERVQRSELEERFAYYLLRTRPADVPPDADVRLSFGRFDGLGPDALSVGEFLEVARSVRELVTGGRAADARDLALPEEATDPGLLEEPLERRADEATAALDDVRADLDALENALRADASTSLLDELAAAVESLGSFPLGDLEAVATDLAGIDGASLQTELADLEAQVSGFDQETTVGEAQAALAAVDPRELGELLALQGGVFANLAADTVDLREAAETMDVEALRQVRTPVEANRPPASVEFDGAAVDDLLDAVGTVADEREALLSAGEFFETVDAASNLPALFALADHDPDETLEAAGVRVHATVEEIQRLRDGVDLGGLLPSLAAMEEAVRSGRDGLPPEADGHVASFREAVLDGLRHALLRSSYFGVQGSVPRSAAGTDADAEESVLEQAKAVESELAGRRDALDELDGTGPERHRRRLETVFGSAFEVLAPVAVDDAMELARTFDPAHQEQLVGDDGQAVETWLHRAARVRDRPDVLRDAYARAEAVAGRPLRDLQVGQLPYDGGDRWVGLPDTDGAATDRRLSLVAELHDVSDFSGPIAGLFVDEWTEVVPGTAETTGLTFQYDAPGNRAPQAILLAVPPDDDGWSVDRLAATVEEALELSKLRTVDPDALGGLGRLLPALCFPENSRGPGGPETVAVEFDHLGGDGR